jgi:hypothetical protein
MKFLIQVLIAVFIVYYLQNQFNSGSNPKPFIDRISENPHVSSDNSVVSKSSNPDGVDFYIRALGDVDAGDLEYAVKVIENFYGYNVKIKSSVDLSENMKISGTDKLINAQNTVEELEHFENTIFIVDKRIFRYDRELRGYTYGNTVIVRGDREIMKETLIHEVGHTLGLGHCDDLTCVMAIKNDEFDSGDFCKKCKKQLSTYE